MFISENIKNAPSIKGKWIFSKKKKKCLFTATYLRYLCLLTCVVIVQQHLQ